MQIAWINSGIIDMFISCMWETGNRLFELYSFTSATPLLADVQVQSIVHPHRPVQMSGM